MREEVIFEQRRSQLGKDRVEYFIRRKSEKEGMSYLVKVLKGYLRNQKLGNYEEMWGID